MSSASGHRPYGVHVTIQLSTHVAEVVAPIPLATGLRVLFLVVQATVVLDSTAEASKVRLSECKQDQRPIGLKWRELEDNRVAVTERLKVVKRVYLGGDRPTRDFAFNANETFRTPPANSNERVIFFDFSDETVRDGIGFT